MLKVHIYVIGYFETIKIYLDNAKCCVIWLSIGLLRYGFPE